MQFAYKENLHFKHDKNIWTSCNNKIQSAGLFGKAALNPCIFNQEKNFLHGTHNEVKQKGNKFYETFLIVVHIQYSGEISELQSRSCLDSPTVSDSGNQPLLKLWQSCGLAKEAQEPCLVDKTKLSVFQRVNSFAAWTISAVSAQLQAQRGMLVNSFSLSLPRERFGSTHLLTYPVSPQQPSRFYFLFVSRRTHAFLCFMLLIPAQWLSFFQGSFRSPQVPARHQVLSTSVFVSVFPF